MDNDSVRAYLAQVDNEYEAVRASAADQFGRMWEKGNPTSAHVENYAAWRKHHASWKTWLWDVQGDWWLSTDDYNTARSWHEQLQEWKKKLGQFADSVPGTPVPDRESTTAEDIKGAAGAATAPLAIFAGAALLGIIIMRRR